MSDFSHEITPRSAPLLELTYPFGLDDTVRNVTSAQQQYASRIRVLILASIRTSTTKYLAYQLLAAVISGVATLDVMLLSDKHPLALLSAAAIFAALAIYGRAYAAARIRMIAAALTGGRSFPFPTILRFYPEAVEVATPLIGQIFHRSLVTGVMETERDLLLAVDMYILTIPKGTLEGAPLASLRALLAEWKVPTRPWARGSRIPWQLIVAVLYALGVVLGRYAAAKLI